MSFIEKLKKDKEGRRLYEREKLIFSATEKICEIMRDRQINKAELARRLDSGKSYVTQLLSGHENMTLAKVADVLYALGCTSELRVEPLEEAEELVNVVSLPTQNMKWAEIEPYVFPVPEKSGNLRMAV